MPIAKLTIVNKAEASVRSCLPEVRPKARSAVNNPIKPKDKSNILRLPNLSIIEALIAVAIRLIIDRRRLTAFVW